MNAYERELLVRYRRADLYEDARQARLAKVAHAHHDPATARVAAPSLGGRIAAWLHRPATTALPTLDPGASVSGHLMTRGARPR